MEQQTIKEALKFLGLVFIVCGGILFTYNLIFTYPFNAYFSIAIIPNLIPPTLIISIGIAFNMVSKAL
ncbi:MAG: hypothetical protein ACFFG0_17745 [Candidatus Thorarchaeota archaeon]